MKTKLVYVLTCAPEATYIEQALMAVFSARHWNPDAHIVLMVDDKTDALLTGKRGEILNYISEKIVVPFEDESLTPMFRSRWIKTQVRQLIKGDFLFVDSDTICCRSIGEIDDFECEVGAVGDNNTTFMNDVGRQGTINHAALICDLSNEEFYFSSGVIYCKDTEKTHRFFVLWHQYWKDGVVSGIQIDQPALAKANMEMKHVIEPIDDVYNCVLYTQHARLEEAAILHIPNYQQSTMLFGNKSLSLVKEQGIAPWVKDMILHIHATYLPYDYAIKYSTLAQRRKWCEDIAHMVSLYGNHIDETYVDWHMHVSIERFLKRLFHLHMYRLGILLWLLVKRMRLSKKVNVRPNICAI